MAGEFLLWTWKDPNAGLFRLGLGWVLLALGGWWLLKAWRQLQALGDLGLKDKAWPVWTEAAAVALLVLFALFMRTVSLDSFPNAGFRDEGEAGNVAVSILNGEQVTTTGTSTPVYIEEVYQNPAGYFYPAALSLKLFGHSMKTMRLNGRDVGRLLGGLFLLCRPGHAGPAAGPFPDLGADRACAGT